jgi:SAM-dependent methyltransferase
MVQIALGFCERDMVQLASGVGTMPAKIIRDGSEGSARLATTAFYRALRDEVLTHNPFLTSTDQSLLRSHYPTMMSSDRYPADLAATIYAARRSPAAEAIVAAPNPVVLDAGCAFGSESFLFAILGAKVLAVDLDEQHIAIAKKRQHYYEEIFDRALDVTFEIANLNDFDPASVSGFESDLESRPPGLSLTWIASVLAAIADQDALLARIYKATRPGGRVMVTDMNLLNPLFLAREFLRRRRAQKTSSDFARDGNFWSMLTRTGRSGARYYARAEGNQFDDVQFFTPATIAKLLKQAGFKPDPPVCSGFGLPLLGRRAVGVEQILPRIPGLGNLGYFYLAAATK